MVLQEATRTLGDLIWLMRILHHFSEIYSNLSLELEGSINQANGFAPILCPVYRSGNRGRPSVIISEAQISGLIEMGFSYATMARMFGISVRTLLRRRNEFGLQIGRNYSKNISDSELDDLIRSLVQVK